MLVVLSRVRSTSWSLCGQDVPRETPDLCPLPGAQGWEVGAHYTESAGRRKQEAASLSSAALPGLSESSYTDVSFSPLSSTVPWTDRTLYVWVGPGWFSSAWPAPQESGYTSLLQPSVHAISGTDRIVNFSLSLNLI